MQSSPNSAALAGALTPDRELIDIALAGNNVGFEQLVLRYQERLYRSIWHVVGCPLVAEDIVQDAFVRAFVRLNTFRKESSFYSWLFRIALNSRRKYFRRKSKIFSLESIDENAPR